jgi:Family of unknown function (DUF6390)
VTLTESRRSVVGTTRFVRYAFMPNRLRYCGGDNNRTILEYAVADVREPPLVAMLHKFTGALPYLALIARRNGIADPFDERVVEAYWIGNELLERVEARELYDHLKERYRKELSPRVMNRVAAKAPAGARPHHSFHVFDVWRQSEQGRNEVLATIDSCRISWGRVTAIEPGEVIVERAPIELRDGKLALGAPRSERVTRMLEGNGFVTDAQVGDVVSIHWSWACEILDERHVRSLERYTRLHLGLANDTI